MKKLFGGKILIIRRTYVAALALFLAVVAIFYVIYHPVVVGRNSAEHVMPIYRVQREEQVIALSFNLSTTDDVHTQRVLNALNNANLSGTFFVTGEWVRANRALAAEMANDGHELMNLSDDHGLLRRLSSAHLQQNLAACSLEIYEIMGIEPSLFRAPYGEYDPRLVEMANAMGMQAVQWSVDSGDWRGLRADAIVEQVLDRAFPGAIVLLHSNLAETALAIPRLIEELTSTGYEILPLSQLIYQDEYVISLSGTQKAG